MFQHRNPRLSRRRDQATARRASRRQSKRDYGRRLHLETFESRLLLASDWQNPFVTRDASGDGVVVPQDALLIINELNQRTVSLANGALPPRSQHPTAPFWSTDGDEFVTPTDVLLVVNALNGDFQGPTITAQLVQDTAPGGAANNDGITRDSRITGNATDNLTGVIGLRAQIDGGPSVAASMEPNGTFSFAPELAVDGSDDGEHTVRFTVVDGRQQSGSFDLSFTLDTRPPNTFALDLAPESDTLPLGDRQTTTRNVSLVGKTDNGSQVDISEIGQLAVADASGDFHFQGVPLRLGSNTFTAQVFDAAGNQGSFVRRITRDAGPTAVVLSEGNSFVVEKFVPVELGQATGSRTLRFEIDASFNDRDQTSASEDTLLVYLVDATDATQTLLDRGQAGTALFAWSGAQADYVPGLVHFDGTTVEIDVTSLSQLTGGRLLFQLLNADTDEGTQVAILDVESVTNPDGVELPLLPVTAAVVDAGGALDTSLLTVSTDVDAQLKNVRFNSSTGRYAAELHLQNHGGALGKNAVVVLPNLPSGVTVLHPSGTDVNGDPYVNFATAIRSGGLGANASSQPILFEFDNVALTQFPLVARVLTGQPNRAPAINPIGPLTVMPGDFLEIPLIVTDQDGDAVSVSIRSATDLPNVTLTGNGRLIIVPSPDQIGNYDFSVVARDGAAETTQQVELDVIADSNTTTRISGRVLKTSGEPLANMRVEVGAVQGLTLADGSFTLNLGSGPPVGDTLKVRGELFPGPLVYPFIAEKVAFVLEHAVYTGVNNVIARPIFLPELDVANGEDIDPAQNETVTTPAIPGASVFVAAGTLMNQQGTPFDGVLHITEVPRELTPAALPDTLVPDLVLTVQPGEMVFASPAPMTFPNSAGWAPGTPMNLWSINPVTGEFDDVGDMQVSADGTTIETISGGVRNSSWHFAAPPPPEILTPPADDTKNQNTNSTEKTLCAPATSECELHSGAILETHDLVSYQSLGVDRGLRLVYDSLRADPRPIVHFSVNHTQLDPAMRLVADLTISRGSLDLQVPGHAGGEFGLSGGEHIWSLPTVTGEFGAALQVDLRDQPSGQYDYTINLGKHRFTGTQFTGSSQPESGNILHVNSIDGPFGSGWGLAGLRQLIENPDGTVLWIDGDGGEILFDAPGAPGQPFVAPPGDFSVLERLPGGTFRRTTKEQTVYEFDSGNRLTSVRDRNGNTTRFDYDAAGRLIKITDPVGLETSLAIGTNGQISTITDPAGRATRLEYDAGGNLIRITDPDSSQRNFEYDVDHHLVAEIDKRGNREELSYDFAGRASQALRKDGTLLQYQPAQVQGLLRPEETIKPLAPPPANALAAAESFSSDGNGNVSRTNLDQAGQEIDSIDAIGRMDLTERNADNLVTRITDARDNSTVFRYDTLGNLLSVRDDITAPQIYVMPSGDFTSDQAVFTALQATGFNPTLGLQRSGWNGPASDLNSFDAVLMLPSGSFMSDAGQTALVSYVNGGGALITAEPFTSHIANFGDFAILDTIIPVTNVPANVFTQATTYSEVTADPILTAGLPDNFTFPLSNLFFDTDLRLVAKNGGTVFYTSSAAAGAGVVGWNVGAGRVVSFSTHVTDIELNNFNYQQLLGNTVEWATKEAGPSYARFTYDSDFNQLTSQKDGDGRLRVLDIDPLNGNARSVTQVVSTIGGADDVVTAFTYTSQGLVDTQTDPLGRVTDFDYDVRGQLVTMTEAKGTVDEGVTRYEYDQAGHRTAVIDELGHRTEYAYDPLNRLLRITEADPDGTGPLTSSVTTITYDVNGNVLSQTDAQGNSTTHQYDVMNRRTRMVDALSGLQSWQYDAQGNVTSMVDELSRTTQYRYDARNRLIETIDPNAGSTRLEYDVTDNVVSMVDPVGNTTVFNFDDRNRVVLETDPLSKSTAYQYDGADHLTVKIDRNNRRTEFIYDDLSRLAGERWGNVVDYTYDKASNVLSAVDFFSSLTYTYDNRNRVLSVDNTGTQQAPEVVLNYTYDAAGNVLTVADTIKGTAGGVNTYSYDALDRVVGISQGGTGVSEKRVNLAYDLLDQITGIDRFSDLAGSQSVVRTQHTFDPLNRITNIAHRRGTSTLAFEDLAYDAASRITQLTDGDGSSTYQHDTRDQLVAAEHSRAALVDEVFTYDDNGNRTSSSHHGNAYQIGPGNRLLSDGTYNYQYDNEGNLVRRTEIATGNIRTYLYDIRKRLQLIRELSPSEAILSQSVFLYDVFNRRIFRSEDNNIQVPGETLVEHFVYDRDNVLLDFVDPDGNGHNFPLEPALERRYLHGPAVDMVLAQDGGAGEVQWLLADHLGSTRDLVDSSGAVQKHFTYDSYGNIEEVTDGSGNASTVGAEPTTRYLFTGREFNRDSGLYYYRARFYDSAIGRFISEDPIGFGGGDMNRYRYVGNNPLSNVDPSGLECPTAKKQVRVQSVENEVAYRTGAGEWKTLTPGTILGENDEIFTGIESNVTVELPEGGTYRVGKRADELGPHIEGGGLFADDTGMGSYNVRQLLTPESRQQLKLNEKISEIHRQFDAKKDRAVDTNFEIQMPTPTSSVRG